MKIAWSVKIPQGAKLNIEDGDKVSIDELIYEYHENIVERLPIVGWQDFGSGDRRHILQNIVKREVTKDEVIGKIGFFSSKVIKSPGSGKCLGVDEFGNIELEKAVDEKYLSPVSAKKVRIEDSKLVFELKGVEFECEGINQLKSWGNYDGLVVDDLNQIDSQQNKQMVVIKDNIDAAIKAEAVGAAGLILVNIEKHKELEDSDIPEVVMKEEDVEKLVKLVDSQLTRIWINATAGKVLVVLE